MCEKYIVSRVGISVVSFEGFFVVIFVEIIGIGVDDDGMLFVC